MKILGENGKSSMFCVGSQLDCVGFIFCSIIAGKFGLDMHCGVILLVNPPVDGGGKLAAATEKFLVFEVSNIPKPDKN